MGIMKWLFGANAAAPPDAMKLDGTTEATLARSLSALSPDQGAWITFAEARILFSTKGAQYAFGEADQGGKKKHRIVRGAAPVRHQLHAGRRAGLFRTRSNRCDEHCGGRRRGGDIMIRSTRLASPALPERFFGKHSFANICYCLLIRRDFKIICDAT
jgi:hypothetical protein